MRVTLPTVLLSMNLLAGCGATGLCHSEGTGQVTVTFSGLPAGVTGSVVLDGGTSPITVTGEQTITAEGGPWSVLAQKAVRADPRVRTAYTPQVTRSAFCLSADMPQSIAVNYSVIPTSNKLWMSNGSGGTGELLGFGTDALTSSGSPSASVSAKAPGGNDVTFDQDGNLWALGPTTADPAIVRFAASELGTSGTKARNRGINITRLDCFPRLAGMAFDSGGNLWVTSPCQKTVMKLSAAQLASTSDELTPVTVGSNLEGVTGVAFDVSGNLWVATSDGQRVLRFDANQLSGATLGSPALQIGVRASDTPGDDSLLSPSWLAFDLTGSLWSNNFGGNILFRIAAAQLTGTGDKSINPAVRITVGVSALLEGFAFDESGALWTAFGAGQFARLGPTQLTLASSSGSPTTPEAVISSSDVGYVGNLALYPAPAGTPLYHRLP